MTDIAGFGFRDDVEFARYLVKEVGVAAVPGSSFYRNARAGADEAAVLLLQEGRDARRSRPATVPGSRCRQPRGFIELRSRPAEAGRSDGSRTRKLPGVLCHLCVLEPTRLRQ